MTNHPRPASADNTVRGTRLPTTANPRSSGAVAFVDVDETLVRDITFLSLYEFDARRHHRGTEAEATLRIFRSLRESGMSRRDSHRWFYRLWFDREFDDVMRTGREWFASRSADPAYFNSAVRERLHELAENGFRIVLVSGSFEAALVPIAEAIGADEILCTQLVLAEGRFTGEVSATMVGPDKAAALRRYAAREGIDLRACAAFGDHHSDIAMFDLVDHPVVVGNCDPALDRYPAERLPG
ncbi:HAD-IB family hydrolase [Nocardia sp. NBC_01503]|uniref:HAD family hydrolase n=1 Tax=Nocardia sp. NBC_01503 TaxID=2975997 RepID=UPI002E7C3230|nr:HAD-IB family hydrolase [Nocardia sp. NBC_01503]WTL32790.1 HAD-IB family hydrolase [Nocardia sp. NBC_01503]